MNDDKALMVVRGRGRQLISLDNRTRLLTRWAASGLSARAFALEAGVAAHQLYDWRRAVRTWAPAAVPLVEVPRLSGAHGWAAEVATRSGPVQLSTAAAPAWAAQLVRELNRC
jgi:transposase-like protein